MGKRGPKSEPDTLKSMRGNPGRRRLGNLVELPAAVRRMPRRPSWLQGKGRTLWEGLGPELLTAGLLTRVDAAMFALLCQVWSDWRDARKRRVEEGDVVVTSTGYRAATAEYFIERQLRQDWVRLANEFGLSPSARAGLNANVDEKGNALQEWLKAKLARAAAAPRAVAGGRCPVAGKKGRK